MVRRDASAALRSVSSYTPARLDDGWSFAETAAGGATEPAALVGADWRPASVPGTVAQSLGAHGRDRTSADLDARDWWFRRRIEAAPPAAGERVLLHFDGLATLAEVWVGTECVATSRNAFRRVSCDLSAALAAGPVDVFVVCRALAADRPPAKPRARWRTRLVEDNRIRWYRTPLAGRIPGWWSGPPAIGPWRPVTLERRRGLDVQTLRLATDHDGSAARLEVALSVAAIGDTVVTAARATVGAIDAPLRVSTDDGRTVIEGALTSDALAAWWPHTHGTPTCHPVSLELTCADGTRILLDAGAVGFRRVTFDHRAGQLSVNGVPLFARGACWTLFDRLGAADRADARDHVLQHVVDTGMNILRVTGCFPYPDAAFFEACDAAGVMVWQDLAFASMDYPTTDPAWAGDALAEIEERLVSWQRHASIAVVGGGSEVAQQAAMLGLGPETWRDPFFTERLAALVPEVRSGTPFVPYIPGGGDDLPFRPDAPVSHYFGVGAYRRDLDDIRRSGVRFAAECLAFSHVCDEASLLQVVASPEQFRTAAWQAGTPRDNAVAWDFADVRDHYLRTWHGIDPELLRATDVAGYLAQSRTVTGEVLAAALSEMRRPGGATGAILWWLHDLVPGDGWGLIDAFGRPKEALTHAAAVLQPLAVLVSLEGLRGALVHVCNDRGVAVDGTLAVSLLRDGRVIETAHAALAVPAHGVITSSAEAILGGFRDITWAYRFGPRQYDALVTTFRPASLGDIADEALPPALRRVVSLRR